MESGENLNQNQRAVDHLRRAQPVCRNNGPLLIGGIMTDFARQQGISEADDWAWRRKLAVMCRIVGMQGSIGLFGHISIRIPGSDVVLITPGAGSEKTGPDR
jgi:hypothetical protein